MASGIPSRRRQMRAMESALSGVGAKAGSTARARSMKSCVASESMSASTWTDARASGSDNEGTRQTISPDTPSASRLVARIRNAGASRSSASTSSAQAAIRCSQLSSTSRSARSRSVSSRTSRADRCGPSRTPRTVAIVCATRSGTESGARSTSHTPSGESFTRPDASRTARRVLPTPPAPVSDTSRDDVSTPGNSRSSFRRPTKLVRSAGRLWRRGLGRCSGATGRPVDACGGG